MSVSGKCKDNNFCMHYGPTERNQPKVKELLRKNQEKVKAICASFSVLASQSVESSFANNKDSKIDIFLLEFDIANSRPF